MRSNRRRVSSSCEIASIDSRSCVQSASIKSPTTPAVPWLRVQTLEDLGELGEVVLVLERDFQSAACYTCLEARRPCNRLRCALRELGIDARAAPRRPRLRARPAGCALGLAHREAAPDDVPCELTALRVSRYREHGPGVAFGELSALEHREHVLGQLEQPQPVRDRGLRAADALRELAERHLEL